MAKFLLVSILAIVLFSCSSDGGDDSEDVSSSSAIGNVSSSSKKIESSSSGEQLVSSSSSPVCPSQKSCLKDERDGQLYEYVTIGTQVWMAENLNYTTASGSYAEMDVGTYYGRYYTWDAAKIACPSGWHLPSDAEWAMLTDYVGSSEAGTKLKSESWKSNGKGTNDYGFSASPGGYYSSYSSIEDSGYRGFWWTSTEYSSTSAYYRGMYSDRSDVERSNDIKMHYYYSIRCVKD